MKLSVTALGTFYEMAREGAGLAATRLNSISDIDDAEQTILSWLSQLPTAD